MLYSRNMEAQEFFFKEVHLILVLLGGLGSVIFYMTSKKFDGIIHRIMKVEERQREHEKDVLSTHRELFELIKKMEILQTRLESKMDIIGKQICKNHWK